MTYDVEELKEMAEAIRKEVSWQREAVRRLDLSSFATAKRSEAMAPIYALKRKLARINARISELGG